MEGEEEDGDDEGDEVEDNEDFVNEKENIPHNAAKEVMQRQSLGGGNKKIEQKKTTTKKHSTQKLVDEAITHLNEKRGSSTEAIKKFIMLNNPDLIERRLKIQIKRYIKNSLADGTMAQIKRSFKLTDKNRIMKKQMEKVKKEKQKEKEKMAKEKVRCIIYNILRANYGIRYRAKLQLN